jgi:hypothetical protein
MSRDKSIRFKTTAGGKGTAYDHPNTVYKEVPDGEIWYVDSAYWSGASDLSSSSAQISIASDREKSSRSTLLLKNKIEDNDSYLSDQSRYIALSNSIIAYDNSDRIVLYNFEPYIQKWSVGANDLSSNADSVSSNFVYDETNSTIYFYFNDTNYSAHLGEIDISDKNSPVINDSTSGTGIGGEYEAIWTTTTDSNVLTLSYNKQSGYYNYDIYKYDKSQSYPGSQTQIVESPSSEDYSVGIDENNFVTFPTKENLVYFYNNGDGSPTDAVLYDVAGNVETARNSYGGISYAFSDPTNSYVYLHLNNNDLVKLDATDLSEINRISNITGVENFNDEQKLVYVVDNTKLVNADYSFIEQWSDDDVFYNGSQFYFVDGNLYASNNGESAVRILNGSTGEKVGVYDNPFRNIVYLSGKDKILSTYYSLNGNNNYTIYDSVLQSTGLRSPSRNNITQGLSGNGTVSLGDYAYGGESVAIGIDNPTGEFQITAGIRRVD